MTAVATKDNAGALSNTVVSSATWRPFGPLASMTFGNSLALTLSYDNDGRVTAINASGGGTTVQNLSYGYDLASNITSIGDGLNTNRNQTFGYDNLNRVTSATGLYGTNGYSYDAVGNRTQKTVTVPFASTDTYTTPATSNRLSSISGGSSRSLSYQASGQASTDQRSPVDAWTYTTDKAGRMTEAKLNMVSQATFAYDGDELRIRKTKTSTGAVTHYIYDAQGQLIAEMDGATGNAIREYIWLGALPIGYIDRLGASGASRLFFVHADHLARPQKFTDSTRATVWDGVFAPFGEIHAITGSIVNVLMFPGQVYDPETGLTQNWHRDYDANIGRYLESDPIGLEGGINTYAYASGSPTNRIDLMGLHWEYSQSSGKVFWIPDDCEKCRPIEVGQGYSGAGAGQDNPYAEEIQSVGPPPRGEYSVAPGRKSHLGTPTLDMTPAPGTQMYGRDLFRLHSDTQKCVRCASQGCIILPRNIREMIDNSPDRILVVVP
jgi:RHS repeat-associated protein